MSEPLVTITTVVINTTDTERLAKCWQKILGVGITRQFADYFFWLEPQEGHAVGLAFQKVPDPTPDRNRLHLDSFVMDFDVARDRIESLGGCHVEDHEMSGFRWSVMADPDANEVFAPPDQCRERHDTACCRTSQFQHVTHVSAAERRLLSADNCRYSSAEDCLPVARSTEDTSVRSTIGGATSRAIRFRRCWPPGPTARPGCDRRSTADP